jgi:hypothetical protein
VAEPAERPIPGTGRPVSLHFHLDTVSGQPSSQVWVGRKRERASGLWGRFRLVGKGEKGERKKEKEIHTIVYGYTRVVHVRSFVAPALFVGEAPGSRSLAISLLRLTRQIAPLSPLMGACDGETLASPVDRSGVPTTHESRIEWPRVRLALLRLY